MKPYFETDLVTLYHGDCLRVIPQICEVDAIVTDPPWPNCIKEMVREGESPYSLFQNAVNLFKKINPKRVAVVLGCNSDPAFLNPLGANGFDYYRNVSLVYDIPYHRGTLLYTHDTAYLYGEPPKGHRQIPGFCGVNTKKDRKENMHPCPRRLHHMMYLIKHFTNENELILDCFAGSGTTMLACAKLNRRCIGIEIEQEYCEIVIKRIKEGMRQPKLVPILQPPNRNLFEGAMQ